MTSAESLPPYGKPRTRKRPRLFRACVRLRMSSSACPVLFCVPLPLCPLRARSPRMAVRLSALPYLSAILCPHGRSRNSRFLSCVSLRALFPAFRSPCRRDGAVSCRNGMTSCRGEAVFCRAVSGTALRDGAFAGDGMPALSASPGADGDIRGHRFCFPQGKLGTHEPLETASGPFDV